MNKPLENVLHHLGSWFSAAHQAHPIGLQMGMRRLNLVQMQEAAAGIPAIRAAAAQAYDCPLEEIVASPQRLKALMQRAFAEQPFKGRRVVSCMPTDQVKIQLVNYQVADGQSDADAIVAELRSRMAGSLDGMVVDFATVRRDADDSQAREAIVAMASREKVTAYLDLLSRAGLTVDAIDVAPVALVRMAAWINPENVEFPPNMLLINFGSASSFLTVVWGRRLMLDRGIDFSERRLFAKVATLLDMPEATAKQLLLTLGLAAPAGTPESTELSHTLKEVLHAEFVGLRTEIQKTLIYAASKTRGRTVDRTYILGSVARYPGIAAHLGEVLSMPVEVLDPFAIFPHQLGNEVLTKLTPHAGVAVAAGLALRNVKVAWPT